MATTNDIKNGTILDLDGELWQVLWFQHHKPGKGNTVVRTKIRNVVNGKVVDRTFPADTKIDMAYVDRQDMQYLYEDATGFVFMDTDTYEQLIVPEALVGDAKDFLLDGMMVNVATNEGNPLYIELPANVEMEVTSLSLACRAIVLPVALSLLLCRPAVKFRFRCSSQRVSASR